MIQKIDYVTVSHLKYIFLKKILGFNGNCVYMFIALFYYFPVAFTT